jgi:hypothetical protein
MTNRVKKNLPDFIYIGTGKAGTTWLFKTLQNHPDLFMAPCKETNYFDLNYPKGIDWYQTFFESAIKGQLVGEISHRYIHHLDSAKRIKNDLGEIKIIVGLRDPVDYCLSDYLYTKRNGRFVGSFDDWCKSKFDWSTINYKLMLMPYLEQFPRENIMIYDFNDLKCNQQNIIDRLTNFLGVNPLKLSNDDLQPVNTTSAARNVFVARYVNMASKFLKRRGGQNLIAKVKYNPFIQKALYREINTKPKVLNFHKVLIDQKVGGGFDWIDTEFGTNFCKYKINL